MLQRAAELGVAEVVLGMAHRGRLNVLTHIFGKPARQIFSEFEGKEFDGEEDLTETSSTTSATRQRGSS